ncbi:MLP-like protein 43 [Salvia hispanica]|uniref:MLP-like protein 43 n=1 Tax=Salvia hispanica TaxID=49212 RepID=UPI002009D431|nr:MLP-like protein 43 [Salvia hispanica]
MANQVETLVASSPTKTPSEKYYTFFKFRLTEIVTIYPAVYKSAEVIEGELGVAGCKTLWTYALGELSMGMKVLSEVIDDATKTIKLTVLDGDVLKLYKSFACTLKVSEGSAQWVIEYERASPLTLPPLAYVPILTTLITLVDAYLLIN